jgi:predicted Rossmann fold flavoprotein
LEQHNELWDVIIVGGGAAGLMAASRAAARGKQTLLLEKNNKIGVKILMSGGTRCNITHATDARGIATAYGQQGKFLRSALAALQPHQVVDIMHEQGVPTKREETGKIFPVSDRAIDVRDALVRQAISAGANLRAGCAVLDVGFSEGMFHVATAQDVLKTSRLLITTGGKSYPGCGTTGDGYAWAAQFGHTIVKPVPALTPLMTNEDWLRELTGITIPDAQVAIVRHDANKVLNGFSKKDFLAARRSSLLLTHFGMSGPAALDVSRVVARDEHPQQLSAICDFYPAENVELVYERLCGDLRNEGKRQVAALLAPYAPKRLAESLVSCAGLPNTQRVAELSKKQIRTLAMKIKQSIIPLSGTLGFKKAEVTAGGVDLREVDSHTMQSKLQPGLFFAGEILDVDGPIGGYNFQAAFSTGWLAAENL